MSEEPTSENNSSMEDVFREELRIIGTSVAALDFAGIKAKFAVTCNDLIEWITHSMPGEEWVDTIPLIFTLSICTRVLGFEGGVIMFWCNGTLVQPQQATQAGVEVDTAEISLPYLGRLLSVPMGRYVHRKGQLVGGRQPISPESMREILKRLRFWISQIAQVPEKDFRPGGTVTEDGLLAYVNYFANDVIRSGATPGEVGEPETFSVAESNERVSRDEAADIIGCTPPNVSRLVGLKDIEGGKNDDGRTVWVSRSSAIHYANTRAKPKSAKPAVSRGAIKINWKCRGCGMGSKVETLEVCPAFPCENGHRDWYKVS